MFSNLEVEEGVISCSPLQTSEDVSVQVKGSWGLSLEHSATSYPSNFTLLHTSGN
jgi:hypothetical protein